jgi:hypothetical protein
LIRVQPQPEPADFDAKVRQPGRRALESRPEKLPNHWRHCSKQLWEAYRGICAYLCIHIPPGTGARSVDHHAPKRSNPDLAYEWSNYRLVCSLMNARKRDFEEVLDPFYIEDGWFILDLSGLQVLPHPELDEETRRNVLATIERLKLNDKECRDARANYYDDFAASHLSFDVLEKRSPFVAMELRRQGMSLNRT